MVAWRIATLWLILVALALGAAPRAGDDAYQVIIDDLELMIEPTDSAYSTATFGRGDRVVVRATQPGWARVAAPVHNFHWINAADVAVQPDGSCVVTRRQATIRYASATARLPGPPVRTVALGAVVRLIDHPDLKVGSDRRKPGAPSRRPTTTRDFCGSMDWRRSGRPPPRLLRRSLRERIAPSEPSCINPRRTTPTCRPR